VRVIVFIEGVTLASVAVAFTAMLAAWRERDEPGALPLVALLFGACLWLSSYLFGSQAAAVEGKILWNEIAWIGVVIIPVAWLLFATEYTGRDQYVTPIHLTALSIVPLLTIVLALTSESHSLLYQNSELVTFQGQVFLNRIPGPWFWVAMGYTYVLLAIGSTLILELVAGKTKTFKGQSVALLLGMLFPWLTSVLYIAGIISIPAFDPTPIAFSLSGVAYLAALTQFQLFDATPSASKHAQRLFIDQLQEGAVVVDSNGFVVEVNRNAALILDIDERNVLGRPAAEAIDQYGMFEESRNTSESVTIESSHTGKLHDITHTEITNSRDRTVGSIYTLHDVSDYVRDQQRHRVLNRLLRHNIRTKTNLIISHAELLADDSPQGELSLVRDSAFDIENMAEKARDVLDIFEQNRQPKTLVSLSSLLADCLTEATSGRRGADIHVDDVPEDVLVPSLLETAYANAIANAIEHNDSETPTVEISVETDDDTVSVTIADDGPGIDEYERSVIEEGRENELSHSSGLGLWMVKWATDIVDGSIEFADNFPSGTVLTITTPRFADPAAATDRLRIDTAQ
jgi:signal transduction histidine kinase